MGVHAVVPGGVQWPRGARTAGAGHGHSERVAVSVDARRLGGVRGQGEARKEGRTELVVLVVVLLLLCLLLLALERGEVGEETAQLLGGLWGMAGLLEVADALCLVSAGEARCGEGRTRRMRCSLSFGDWRIWFVCWGMWCCG